LSLTRERVPRQAFKALRKKVSCNRPLPSGPARWPSYPAAVRAARIISAGSRGAAARWDLRYAGQLDGAFRATPLPCAQTV